MKMRDLLVAAGASMVLAGSAFGQTGTLDQESPAPGAWYNADASSLTWQQQVRCGIAGQLEGISLYVGGTAGVSNFDLQIGLGDAWSTNYVHTENIVVAADQTWQFIDLTGSNINLGVGDTFVIEVHGTDTGAAVYGTYVAPPGDPLYDEPLWLNSSPFSDGGWRHGLRSYMLTGPVDCLDMAVSTLTAGQTATWDIAGADSGANGVVAWGTALGQTLVNGTFGYCADFGINGVNQNRVVGFWAADANGDAQVQRRVPGNVSGLTVHTQAAQQGTCPDECMSAVDSQTVQ